MLSGPGDFCTFMRLRTAWYSVGWWLVHAVSNSIYGYVLQLIFRCIGVLAKCFLQRWRTSCGSVRMMLESADRKDPLDDSTDPKSPSFLGRSICGHGHQHNLGALQLCCLSWNNSLILLISLLISLIVRISLFYSLIIFLKLSLLIYQ